MSAHFNTHKFNPFAKLIYLRLAKTCLIHKKWGRSNVKFRAEVATEMHSRVVDNDTIIVITDDIVPLIQQTPTLQALSFKCRQGTNSNAMSTIKNLYIF